MTYREKIQLTDDDLAAQFSDLTGIGVAFEDLTFGPTAEIDSFRRDRRRWIKKGETIVDRGDVFSVIGAAALKGQAKRDVAVVKFGDACAILGMDR